MTPTFLLLGITFVNNEIERVTIGITKYKIICKKSSLHADQRMRNKKR